MSKVFNMVGGGGKNISSIIITGLTSTDTITCTKDGKTYPATWDDTSQHWEIVGLPLGTFTVTATNGTKTTTETVLIDIAGVYEIEMDYTLWLYRDNDECEDITGGWSYDAGAQINFSLTKRETGLYASTTSTVSGAGATVGINNGVDFTPYTKLCFLFDHGGSSDRANTFYIGTSKWGGKVTSKVVSPTTASSYTDVLMELDVSSINSVCFVYFRLDTQNACHKTYINLKRAWLE